MKNNTDRDSRPALTLPRFSSRLERLVDDLARFAEEFGIDIDGRFPSRLSTISFANGMVLAVQDAVAATQLEALLVGEALPRPVELVGLTDLFVAEYKNEENWTDEVSRFLGARWVVSADNQESNDFPRVTQLTTLHAIRMALHIARESPETAKVIAGRTTTLWLENQFLSGCLYGWSGNGWVPPQAPFLEFTANCYKAGTRERTVICKAISEVYPIAKALNNPWDLSFWIETGWNGGRKLAQNQPNDCKGLLEDATAGNLKYCHDLYRRLVLGTLRSDGEVQIEKATLKYIGEFGNGDLARSVCTGREPRRLARFAYDFAFWMGIFSAHPIPTAALDNG